MDQVKTEVPESPSQQDAGLTSSSVPQKQFSATSQQPLRQRALVQKHSEWYIRNILVPTDYSPISAKALQRAMCIANQCDAAITILHVVDVNAQSSAGT